MAEGKNDEFMNLDLTVRPDGETSRKFTYSSAALTSDPVSHSKIILDGGTCQVPVI